MNIDFQHLGVQILAVTFTVLLLLALWRYYADPEIRGYPGTKWDTRPKWIDYGRSARPNGRFRSNRRPRRRRKY